MVPQVRSWDAQTGDQIKKSAEHESFVNSICPIRRGPPLFASASDDATVKVWDQRSRRSVVTFRDRFQITCVAFADAGDQVYSGGLDNCVKVREARESRRERRRCPLSSASTSLQKA